MYKYFFISLLNLALSTGIFANALNFDGQNSRNNFLSMQAPNGSITEITFKNQNIDTEFVEKLEIFFNNQKNITSLEFHECTFQPTILGMYNFHYLTHLEELESFTMTDCNVNPEMARIVLANLNGYTITNINFSGNPLLDQNSKSIIGGKFGGTITWGDGSSVFEFNEHGTENTTPRGQRTQPASMLTPHTPQQPQTQPASAFNSPETTNNRSPAPGVKPFSNTNLAQPVLQ